MTVWPVLPASGVGSRMQAQCPKQYLTLHGRYLLDHTLDRILSYPAFSQVVLVLAQDDTYFPNSQFANDTRIVRATGGSERCYSVLNGLKELTGLAKPDDWVLVHDVARPCLHHSDLDKLLAGLGEQGAILASPVRDTMKRAKTGRCEIDHTVERQGLWHALTPQVFRYEALQQALEQALAQGFEVTDEASAMEFAGWPVNLVEGRADNIKVTRPEDLALAEFFLNRI